MSPLEQLEQETYPHLAAYYADVASPQYRNLPAWRDAITRKLERSTAIHSQLPQSPSDINRVTVSRTQDPPPVQVLPDEDEIIREGGKISIRVGRKGLAAQVAANQKGRR